MKVKEAPSSLMLKVVVDVGPFRANNMCCRSTSPGCCLFSGSASTDGSATRIAFVGAMPPGPQRCKTM